MLLILNMLTNFGTLYGTGNAVISDNKSSCISTEINLSEEHEPRTVSDKLKKSRCIEIFSDTKRMDSASSMKNNDPVKRHTDHTVLKKISHFRLKNDEKYKTKKRPAEKTIFLTVGLVPLVSLKTNSCKNTIDSKPNKIEPKNTNNISTRKQSLFLSHNVRRERNKHNLTSIPLNSFQRTLNIFEDKIRKDSSQLNHSQKDLYKKDQILRLSAKINKKANVPNDLIRIENSIALCSQQNYFNAEEHSSRKISSSGLFDTIGTYFYKQHCTSTEQDKEVIQCLRSYGEPSSAQFNISGSQVNLKFIRGINNSFCFSRSSPGLNKQSSLSNIFHKDTEATCGHISKQKYNKSYNSYLTDERNTENLSIETNSSSEDIGFSYFINGIKSGHCSSFTKSDSSPSFRSVIKEVNVLVKKLYLDIETSLQRFLYKHEPNRKSFYIEEKTMNPQMTNLTFLSLVNLEIKVIEIALLLNEVKSELDYDE